MLLNKEQVESIKNRKVTHVKNFALLEREYDYNLISDILEETSSTVLTKTSIGNLRDVYQILKITNFLPEFRVFFDFFIKTFKFKLDPRDAVEIFFSFVAQAGPPHDDIENVFIIGLKGKTIYRVFFKKETIDYEINKGDMIFIPPGISHKVIGITPRIIASVGFFDRQLELQM
tara:strand:+ start:221 stop:742 length:522 start_codon:yes stop_codon:yes gene_type:complete